MKYAVIALFSFWATGVQAGESNTFGVDLMLTKSDVACNNVEEVVINPLFATSCEDSTNGFRLYYKRQLTESVSLETGYQDFGEIGWHAHFTGFPGNSGPDPITEEDVDFSASGVDLAVRKDFYADSFSFFLKSGLIFAKADYSFERFVSDEGISDTSGNSQSDSSASFLYGFGFQAGWFEVSYVIYNDIGTDDIGETDVSALIAGVRF
jgi:hypothetical protein